MSSSFAADIYLPSLSQIAADANITLSTVGLILSIFFTTYAFAQLFVGPLTDRYGRKPILVGGLSLYAIGSIVSVFIPHFEVIIIGRILQGLGVAAISVCAIASIHDSFSGSENASKQASLNGFNGFVPAMAPAIGTVLQLDFGWKGAFNFVMILSIIIFLCAIFFVKETAPNTQKISISQLKRSYSSLFKSYSFIKNLLIYTLSFTIFLILITNSKNYYIHQCQISIELYGVCLAIGALSIPITSLLTARLTLKYKAKTLIYLGCLITLIGLHFISFMNGSWMVLLIGSIFTFSGVYIIMPNALTKGLQDFGYIAGTATSALGFSRNFGAALALMIIGATSMETSSITILLAVLSIIIIGLESFKMPRTIRLANHRINRPIQNFSSITPIR